MTKKLRFEAFRNMLRQDIGFFDDPRHATGVLCTRFATDAPNVRYVFTRLPLVVSSIVTLVGAITIGLLCGWKLALVLLAILPLFGKNLRNTKLMELAGKLASEAVENVRTVQALNKQRVFCDKFCENLVIPYRANMGQVYGVVYGFAQSMTFVIYALGFWVGATFVNDQSMEPTDVYRVFFAFAFCGQAVGQLTAFIPDVVKARIAASRLLRLIDYPSKIDALSSSGSNQKIRGAIRFENVNFSYPSRSGTSVLNGLNLDVDAGETVSLVGYSGSGKSTVMSLMERLYNPCSGRILIDCICINDINVHRLREQVAIVSQEPTLFDCTVAENICYGLGCPASYDEIVAAAKQANIHDFVLSLPMGYDTR
ncbi:P-glycoprotein, partial [Aphelenchoides avenae]